MKKFFLFAAAVVAAITVNAKVYDFSTITLADVNAGSLNVTEEQKDGAPTGKILIEVPSDQTVVEVILFGEVKLHYNSDKVVNIVVDTKNGYFEFPGNGKTADGKALVTLENLDGDEEIVFEAANKGTGSVAIKAIEGCTGDDVALPAKDKTSEQADAGGYIWVTATYTANASSVTVSTPSARVRKIIVGAGQAIDNVDAAVKAVKTFENGQLVIIKNGVKYNAIGAVIE